MAQRPEGAELQRTESFQYPAAHVGHLNDKQSSALNQFKELLLKDKRFYTPQSDQRPASHDDETLLRYLRARKFVPADALKQFNETEEWRKENQLDKLYESIDIDEYEQSRRLYPQWLGRRDKRGIPVYLFEIAHLDNKALAAYEKNSSSSLDQFKSKVPAKMLRLFALYENLCRFVLPMCSTMPDRQHPETPISQSSNIVDVSGVSLMQFWKLKAHMQDASILATAHYPETLDRIFLLGAPSFFPTVWSWVKRWFDPITVSKIFILSQKETLPTLTKFIDIEDIPIKYGGKLDFKFGDLPKIDNKIATQLHWTNSGQHGSIPTGPIRWQYSEKGELQAVAVGTQRGVQRHDVIATTSPSAKVAMQSLSAGRIPTAAGAFPTMKSLGKTGAAPEKDATATPPSAKTNPGPSTSNITPVGDLPYRDSQASAADKMSGVREGTSLTRYEQQTNTHADGNVGDGTPAIARDGQGEKQAIMEPSTVGQAPKEHPLPDTSAPPTMIEQAQHTAEAALQQATAAGQSVLAAVGLGEKKVEEPVIEEKKHDPTHDRAIDGMEGGTVEEFLRAKHQSTAR